MKVVRLTAAALHLLRTVVVTSAKGEGALSEKINLTQNKITSRVKQRVVTAHATFSLQSKERRKKLNLYIVSHLYLCVNITYMHIHTHVHTCVHTNVCVLLPCINHLGS